MITNTLGQQICRIYTAAFLRAPDKGGYEYWLNTATASSLAATIDTMFSLDVVKAVYPASMTNAQFVTAIYNNVFSKSPDDGGLAYWKAFLDTGAKTRGGLVLDIINAGLSTPEGTSGRDVIVNRVNYAMGVVEQQQSTGTDLYATIGDAAMKQTFATVTADTSTVESALSSTATQSYLTVTTLTENSDKFTGTSAADRIDAGMGADSIDASSGNDYIIGGTGNDTLWGSFGSDLIDAGSGDDLLYGGTATWSDNDTTGTDTLIGGTGNDTLYGGEAADYLMGGGNADYLYGGNGNDTIDGGTGNDGLYGEEGNDSLVGGVGNDTLESGSGNDTLLGGDGNDTFYGGNDYTGTGSVYIDGGAGDDWISVSYTNSTVTGGAGNDTISGGSRNDSISGGDGQDTINGGEGRDTISGGEGTDTIVGGSGDDTINLSETSSSPDFVRYIRTADFGETGDTITGFDASDVLQINRSLFNELGSGTYSGQGTSADIQTVSNATTAFTAGKTVFLIQGASAAADTLSAAASFLDAYGNNQTYGASDALLFVFGVGSNTTVYYYVDDNAGDAQVTAEELTHVVTLVGTSVSNLTAANLSTANYWW